MPPLTTSIQNCIGGQGEKNKVWNGNERHVDLKVRNKIRFLENLKECESIGIECITLAQMPI